MANCFPGYYADTLAAEFSQFGDAFGAGITLCGDGQEIENYISFKLMDDPTQDVDTLLDNYFSAMYGPAATAMHNFYDLVEQTYADPTNYPSGLSISMDGINWGCLGTPDVMTQLQTYMTEAVAAVGTGNTYATNVNLFNLGTWSYMLAGQQAYLASDPLTVSVSSPAVVNAAPTNQITITANASDTDGTVSSVTFYGDGNLLGVDTNGADGWSWNWTNPGLGEHELRVVAVDSSGYATASTDVAVTVTACGATPASATQINLEWLAFGGTISGYNIYRGTTPDGENYSTPLNGGTLVTTTTYNDATASANTTYYYIIEAVTASGSSTASNEINAMTYPTVSTGLAATPVSASQIDLSWTASSGAISGYNIYRGTTPGGENYSTPINGGTLVTTTTYSDTTANYTSSVLNNNPAGYYLMNETAGTTAVNIGSARAAGNGVYSGITLNQSGPSLSGMADASALFGGPSAPSSMTVGGLTLGSSYTVEMWIDDTVPWSSQGMAYLAGRGGPAGYDTIGVVGSASARIRGNS